MTDQEVRRCLQAFGVPADNPFDDLLAKLDSVAGTAPAPASSAAVHRGDPRKAKAAAAA